MFIFQVEYYIKWEGYSSDENSWEPEENISKDLIREFKEQHIEDDKDKNNGKYRKYIVLWIPTIATNRWTIHRFEIILDVIFTGEEAKMRKVSSLVPKAKSSGFGRGLERRAIKDFGRYR